MPDHFQEIYASSAEQYEAMAAREDYQNNIPAALHKIRPLAGLEVVEFGTGTGRFTAMLAPLVKSIRAFDASQHMLDVAISKLKQTGLSNWTIEVGDNRALPVTDASADLTIQGWSFGHYCGWYPETWRDEIDKAINEMKRILRPGGVAIMFETLGTGFEAPRPPTPELAEYYARNAYAHGFSGMWIRTDYQFDSVAQAQGMTRFFFGDELAQKIVNNNWAILPECTGIWWWNKP